MTPCLNRLSIVFSGIVNRVLKHTKWYMVYKGLQKLSEICISQNCVVYGGNNLAVVVQICKTWAPVVCLPLANSMMWHDIEPIRLVK